MRGRVLSLLLLVGLVLPVTAPAQAALDRVRLEVDRTEHRIERARAVVGASGNAKVHAEIDRAAELQASARTALGQGRSRIALDLTLRARAAADRASAIINGLPDPERVVSQLNRTREMLDRARGQIEGCNRDRPRALLSAAADMQRRGEEAAHSGHHLAALQLTMGARERVLRALQLCNVGGDARDGAERALRTTDEAIQRARERVAADRFGAGHRPLSRAIAIQVRAKQEFQAQRLESSVRLTLSARALAIRAARVADRAR
jgi:hypothetical protein